MTKMDRAIHLDYLSHHLFDALPLGVVLFDKDLSIKDLNSSAHHFFGNSRHIASALSDGYRGREKLKWDDILNEALTHTEPSIFENIPYSHDGRNYNLHIICTPLKDEKTNSLAGGTLVIEDITSKVGMENDLAAAERLAAVGKLAAKVAHELNNPLDGILRYINLALRLVDQDGPEQASQYLQESRKGLMRMVQIISELLEFSRSTFSAFEETEINKIVDDAVKSMESLAIKNQVDIHCDYSPSMPQIRSGNLFQVFCNLIKNAIDAMDQGGQVTIKTFCDDHNALIEIHDTGPGISEDLIERLFEPFFTTKDTGKGTGLGLAICKDIVERFNGKIDVNNRPEGGCVFTVTIPLARTSRGH